jgi:hypothetical protein
MTITMTNSATNSAVKVEKSAVDTAVKLAEKWQKPVVIYRAEIAEGQPKKVLSALKFQFEASPLRHKLELIATIDQNGNFVD